MRAANPRERGVVLAMVLILALVLSAAIFAFMRRAMVDTVVIQNRDKAAQAEALARGGVRLAVALLLEDLALSQGEGNEDIATLDRLWARTGELELTTPEGGTLELEIRDAGAKLNLNALVDHTEAASDLISTNDDDPENFLTDLLTKVIDEVQQENPGHEVRYDPRELAANLLDYIDPDDVSLRGGAEDDYYQRQNPPYRAANRPLLSVDEIRRIEGFDAPLFRGIRDYVTVYPLGGRQGSEGVNLNTAPPHVLATISHGGPTSFRLVDEDIVRRILRSREEGNVIRKNCDGGNVPCERITAMGIEGSRYPPATIPANATVFEVTSRATAGDIQRSITAVIDRTTPDDPLLLSWRVR